MSQATLTFDPRFFRDIPMPRQVLHTNQREFPTLTSKFDLLADIVERNWGELPQSIKDLAKAYTYYRLETEEKPSLWDRLQFGWFMFRNITAQDEVTQLQTAMIRLSDAVLTAIERENPEYQRRVNEALDAAFDEKRVRAMTPEQIREWMRRI